MPGFHQARLRQKAGLFAAVATLVIVSCTSEKPAPPPKSSSIATDQPALPAATLPDLSTLEPATQQQINERYRTLTALLATTGSTAAGLADAYGSIGNLLMAAGHTDAAEPFYLHAQSLQPNDLRWPYYLGHVYMTKTELDKAARSFERALELQPNDVASLIWLGKLYLDHGDAGRAEMMFTRALMIQPQAVAAMYGVGQAALAKQDFARAVEQFERVLAADSRASAAHYPLALAYRGLGQTAKAEQHLRQRGTVEIGPPDPLMMELRGLLQGATADEERGTRALTGRDYASAVQYFRAAVEHAPDNGPLRHKLGTALSLTGDTAGALIQFREALRVSPDFAPAHFSIGVLMSASGQYKPAIEHLSAAVKYDPAYGEARLQLADALIRAGRVRDARKVLTEGIKLDPEQARFSEALKALPAD